MSSKKGKGSSNNLRDSKPKYLGVKLYDGEKVLAGGIIIRQRGTKFFAKTGVGMGRDHTLFAKRHGYICFSKSRNRRWVSVLDSPKTGMPKPEKATA